MLIGTRGIKPAASGFRLASWGQPPFLYGAWQNPCVHINLREVHRSFYTPGHCASTSNLPGAGVGHCAPPELPDWAAESERFGARRRESIKYIVDLDPGTADPYARRRNLTKETVQAHISVAIVTQLDRATRYIDKNRFDVAIEACVVVWG